MEDKKYLWIIFAVGLCVLVVVGIGFVWFMPQETAVAERPVEGSVVPAGEEGFDPVEWVREGEEYPGLEAEETASGEGEFEIVTDEVVYGVQDEPTRSRNDGSAAAAAEAGADEAAEGNEAESVVSLPGADRPAQSERTVITEADRSLITRADPAPAAEKRAASAGAAVSGASTEYWIQVGSFSSSYKAGRAKEELASKGFQTSISSLEIDGTNFFRVRMGPYPAKQEAEKFLDWVKGVDGYGESYISVVYP